MDSHFTLEHFELLQKWQGTVYDPTDEEHRQVRERLTQAYGVTKRWVEAIRQRYFPLGESKTHCNPTDQWHHKFLYYNWGKIYPSPETPRALAYNMGINAKLGCFVKIDVIDKQTKDPTLRPRYEALRGPMEASPIVALMPAEEGAGRPLEELTDWAIESLRGFKPGYNELAAQLGLTTTLDDEAVLKRFQGRPAFRSAQASWSAQDQALFCRLARAVHAAGLDWWHGHGQTTLRFGRKHQGTGRAVGLLGALRGAQARTISWTRPLGPLSVLEREPLTEALVEQIEAALANPGEALDDWRLLEVERPGLWPDQLKADTPNPEELRALTEDPEVLEPGPGEAQPVNRIYYGPPGTGKTYALTRLLQRTYGEARRHRFVTFHPSYGYEEFVEGLRPVLDEATEAGAIRYEVRAGVFKELCRAAQAEPGQRFAMVIDEINRGHISKIFGELLTLIEPDKRCGARHAVEVILPYSGEPFSVPANVDLYGTMNSADRSLALLDTALRRRFEFVAVLPDARDEQGAPLAGLRVHAGAREIHVPRLLEAMNERIEALHDRDHCLGHAYFTHLAEVPDGAPRMSALREVFSHRILPLLEEHFFEDWRKIRLILADNQKPTPAQFILESADHEDELGRLFGPDHGLDSYGTRRRYARQEEALSRPEAYIGIYESLPMSSTAVS